MARVSNPSSYSRKRAADGMPPSTLRLHSTPVKETGRLWRRRDAAVRFGAFVADSPRPVRRGRSRRRSNSGGSNGTPTTVKSRTDDQGRVSANSSRRGDNGLQTACLEGGSRNGGIH